ncbi:MAG TPA: asparaginase [Longimicrobiales bacterium]|nr:asparaginase [Longimicrobiales bacterium]
MNGVRVEVLRGARVESIHVVDLAVLGTGGEVLVTSGDAASPVFARSALKPFQAIPLVEDGVVERFGLTDEELALCCASHSGEPRHVQLAASILARIALGEDALACGPHVPFDDAAAGALRAAGREPGRLHNNCSGKHAGMLALAAAHGWQTEGYHLPEHPVQRRMMEEACRWGGVEAEGVWTGADGCGVVTFGLPLTALARAFARLVAAEPGSPGARVVAAMTGHPFLVGGTDRLCTRLMEVTSGRVLAKVGAEGVYGAASREGGVGVALKARDGARRAAEAALPGVLEALDLLRPGEVEALEPWGRQTLRNTRGERVGEVRAAVELGARRG